MEPSKNASKKKTQKYGLRKVAPKKGSAVPKQNHKKAFNHLLDDAILGLKKK